MSANSIATKNALALMIRMVAMTTNHGLLMGTPGGGDVGLRGRLKAR